MPRRITRFALSRLWLLACLGLVLPPAVGAVGSGPAVAATKQTALDGTFRIMAVTPVPGTTAKRHDIPVLHVADKRYELELPPGMVPTNGARVRVTGELTGRIGDLGSEIMVVSNVDALVGPSGAMVASAPPSSGTSRVLVMLVQWTAPDSVTPASANAQVFTDTNNWYVENSYSQLSLTGSVTNWLSIPAPSAACDTNDIMNNARTAATSAGFNLANFDQTMAYFPNDPACGFAGAAEIASGVTWINGSMNRRVTVHELGHNFGLFHAHSYTCRDAASNQVVFDDLSQCVIGEYGDPFDAMGASGYVGHFSAYQKDKLGWLGGSRVVTLGSGGSATLPPFENNTAGTLVARIVASPTRTYWLEYRQAVGFDSALPTGGLDGVLVRMYDSTLHSGAPELLDERPGGAGAFTDAALPFNSSWTSPENLRFTVGAQGANGVPVSVASVSNDNFANALIVTQANASPTGNNATATKEPGEPNHAGNAGGHSMWYRWTPAGDGTVRFDTSGSTFQTLLGVYTGTAVNALTTIGSDAAPDGFLTSVVTLSAVGGTTYRIAVDGSGGVSGNFTLNMQFASAPPPNDNFASPQAIGGKSGSSTPVLTTGASKEPGEPLHGGDPGGRSVWYRWTAPSSGHATFDTVGSPYDTLLGVYRGSAVNALTTIASNDDEPLSGNRTSRVTFAATNGTTYQIAIDGFAGEGGTARLNWSLTGGPPGDYTGDGKVDIAIFRPSTGAWYVDGGTSTYWGITGDIPVLGDFAGDGMADFAIYRPATGAWYVKDGTNGFWGGGGDVPLPLPAAIGRAYFSPPFM